MSRVDPRRVREVYDRAVGLAASEIGAYLDGACAGDEALRREVASLLRFEPRARAFLPATEAPPRRLGPYELLDPLGQGGQGSVHRARHVETGELVALKTVRDAKQHSLGSFRREIQTLARMRHPGVVRILGFGGEDRAPWYAMELLEGATMATLLARELGELSTVQGGGAPASPIPAVTGRPAASRERLLALVHRVCAPLGYLHGEGIVHRDLKPANVVLRPDGSPVLVDLGLAAPFSGVGFRERLRVEGHVVGTVLYMSPEQVRGELVDARSDLYALGCILFECLAGRPPFVGDGASVVLQMHLEAPPPDLAALDVAVPAGLQALVLALLAKQPAGRPGYARDVALELERLGFGAPVEAPRARAYLYLPRLAGRDKATARIAAALDEAAAGHGGILLVAGERGIGKTRLALEASREALRRRMQVLSGECRAMAGEPSEAPLQALAAPLQHIADLCREGGERATARILGRRARVLAPYAPELERLPGVAALPLLPALPPLEARLRLHAALWDLLVAAATSGGPLLLMVDDLHAADELSLEFLAYLARAPLATSPLLFLGTYLSGEAPAPLARLAGRPGVERVTLAGLGPGAVRAMVGDMLAIPDPERWFVDSLVRESEGNPLFVSEYLRTAVWEELLVRDEEGRWRIAAGESTLPLPATIRQLLERRLRDLSDGGRRMAEIAAIVGRRFSPGLVTRLSSMSASEAAVAMEELVARAVLEELPTGQLAFSHDKFREVASGDLPAPRKVRMHRACAEEMERSGEGRPGEIGHHWEQAGEEARARGLFLVGARGAAASYAYVEAESLYRGYLKLADGASAGGAEPEVLEARIDLAYGVLDLMGRRADAIGELEVAARDALAAGDEPRGIRARRELAWLLHGAGRLEEADAMLGDVVGRARAAGLPLEERLAVALLAIVSQEQGRMDEARELYDRALELNRAAGDARNEGSVLLNLATLHHRQRRHAEARLAYDRALELFRRLSDPALECAALANIGALELEAGDAVAAEELYRHALGIATEIGHRASEGLLTGNLGICRGLAGDAPGARELHGQAHTIARAVGDPHGAAMNELCIASLDHEAGRNAEAAAACERLLATPAVLRDPQLRGAVQSLRGALMRLLDGDLALAEAIVVEAEELLAGVGDLLEAAKARCERGHLALAAGRDAGGHLAAVERCAEELGVATGSDLGRRIGRLRRAVEHAATGGVLHRGELPE